MGRETAAAGLGLGGGLQLWAWLPSDRPGVGSCYTRTYLSGI